MFNISCRNVLRNKRRSLLSLIIIIVGVTVLFLFKGYMAFCLEGLTSMQVDQFGNIQIAKAGFWDSDNQERNLLSSQEIQSIFRILKRTSGVKKYSTELGFSGILGTETKSIIVVGTGIEPGKRQNTTYRMTSGVNLFSSDIERVLLGQGVMKKLGVHDDEWVSILTTTIDGANNAASLQISGSYTIGNTDVDNSYIRVPIAFVQTLLNTDGVDKIIVDLKNNQEINVIIAKLRTEFKKFGLKVELKSWYDLATYFQQVKSVYETVFMFMSIIIFTLVFLSIFEIMSMSFFERMNEIGTIRAIGTKRYQIFSMLAEEALIIGTIGGTLGISIGWCIGRLINDLQITYVAPDFADPVPLFINLTMSNALVPFIIVLIAITASAVYPAVKASKLDIVQILRHL